MLTSNSLWNKIAQEFNKDYPYLSFSIFADAYTATYNIRVIHGKAYQDVSINARLSLPQIKDTISKCHFMLPLYKVFYEI